MATINLYGAGGHAKVIMEILEAQGWSVGCLYDDAPNCNVVKGHPVFGAYERDVEGPMIISIGSNNIRKYISGRFAALSFPKAIHPGAIVSPTVIVGNGSVVMQGAIIQSDAVIGKHCIINTGASVDHECRIEDYVHIAPHATLCGNVHVGEGAWVGAGAVIIPGITIGKWSIIGAGSVVVRNIPDGVTAYGNPCKIIKENK